jgi:hypothetical protein
MYGHAPPLSQDSDQYDQRALRALVQEEVARYRRDELALEKQLRQEGHLQ